MKTATSTRTRKAKTVVPQIPVYKQIHTVEIRKTENSWSTTDRYCYTSDSEVLKSLYGIHKKTTKLIELQGEMVEVTNYLVCGSSYGFNFNSGMSDIEKQERYEKLLKAGFSDGRPDLLQDRYNEMYGVIFNTVNCKEREDANYVLYKLREHRVPKDYVGGFRLEVIFVETLIQYIERGLVFGYIGHSYRKVWVDEMLAEIVLPHLSHEEFAGWLTSSDGRHYMDGIEHLIDVEDREEVKKHITENLPRIHNTAKIYNYPTHEGNLKSSREIFEILKDAGMLMGVDEDSEYN